MSTAALRALESGKDRFGDGRHAAAKLRWLRDLEHATLGSARAVYRLHEVLCFLRAYADDARILAQVERMLEAYARRPDLLRFRDALADTGIAGTVLRYRFFWVTLVWLARRWPRQLRIDSAEAEVEERIGALLPLLVSDAEALSLKRLDLPAFAAIARLCARGESAAVFLARRIARLPGDAYTREATHDAIEPGYELLPGRATPSRTQARHGRAPVAYQRAALARARPDLRAELSRPWRRIRRVSAREGGELIELARGAMLTRSRDLDAFAYGNARDVRLVDDGGGLALALIGIVPERRQLFPSTCGYLVLRNGVPIGYGEAFVLARHAIMSFNIFESFRGGEAAHSCARVLATVHQAYAAACFSFDSYQLGKGNEEGIASGAWWFYYKLGFRPTAPAAQRILRAELARMRARPAHRSSPATLRALAESPMAFELEAGRRPRLQALELPGKRLSAALARLPDGAREAALEECVSAALRITGLGTLRGRSAAERLAWRRWSPVVVHALAGVRRWSEAERQALAQVMLAKGGRNEDEFLRRYAEHPRLERALFGPVPRMAADRA